MSDGYGDEYQDEFPAAPEGSQDYGADDFAGNDDFAGAAEPQASVTGPWAAEGDEDDYGDDDYDEEPVPGRGGRRPSGGPAAQTYERPSSRQTPPQQQHGAASGFGQVDAEARRLNAALQERLAAEREEAADLRTKLEKYEKKEKDRRASKIARHELSVQQLQDEIYELSTKLVGEGAKNAKLAESLGAAASERDALKKDHAEARSALVNRITHGASSRDKKDPLEAYANVTVVQLLELRERAMEHELKGRQHLLAGGGRAREKKEEKPAEPTEPLKAGDPAAVAAAVRQLEEEIARLRARVRHADDEKQSLRAELRGALAAGDDVRALKHKSMELLNRGEKDKRANAENELKLAHKKVLALGDHVEKLMVHLKHEVGAKAQVHDQLKRAERELDRAKDRAVTLAKRNNSREKFVLELKEGSKILEDQLRLMDRRYLELRAKLDWTRHHADRQVKKAKQAASTLRAKWALATNSQQGLLDNVELPPSLPGSQLSAFGAPDAREPEYEEAPRSAKQTRFAPGMAR